MLLKALYILNMKDNISIKKFDEQEYYADCVRKNKLPKYESIYKFGKGELGCR